MTFAVYERINGSYCRITDFLNDSFYLTRIDEAFSTISHDPELHLFPLFPDRKKHTSETARELFIFALIVTWPNELQAHEQSSRFTVLSRAHSLRGSSQDNNDPSNWYIDNREQYYSTCIYNIIVRPWYEFGVMIYDHLVTTVYSSISKLTDLRAPFLPLTTYPLKLARDRRDQLKSEIESDFSSVYFELCRSIEIIEKFHRVPNYTQPSSSMGSQERIPNMMLMFRTFTRTQSRFDNESTKGYDYDVSIIIPSADVSNTQLTKNDETRHLSQHTDLRRYLQSLDKDAFLSSRRFCNYGLNKSNSFLYEELDNWFWDTLANDEGIERIIQIIRSWVGSGTRSFTDPVFASGLMQIRFPFEQGGLRRVHGALNASNLDQIEGAQRIDLYRIVAAYYILLGMAPASPPTAVQNLALVQLPIEVGGTVWGVACYVVPVEGHYFDFSDTLLWFRNFHYSDSIKRSMESSARAIITTRTIAWIRQIVENTVLDIDSISDNVAFWNALNSEFGLIESILPLEIPVVFNEPDNSVKGTDEFLYLQPVGDSDNEMFIAIPGEITNNRIFPKLASSAGSYISHDRIKDIIQLAFLRAAEKLLKGGQHA